MRVTVGVPAYEHFKAEMAISLVNALLRFPHELHFTCQRGAYIDVGREFCLRDALGAKSDYLVFVDTDLVFREDALERLLSHGKDVVGANYYEKRLPLTSTVRLDDGKGGYLKGQFEMPTEPFKCAAVATGLMAINLKRLTQCMAPPYFSYGTLGTEFQGEDIGFCKRARAAGLDVWCDPTIKVLHMGEFPYGILD